MKRGTIYCEYSGAVADAMTKAGVDCMSCDLLPRDGKDQSRHIQGDAIAAAIERSIHDEFSGVHWPCTYFANSSVRWMYGGKGTVIDPARLHLMKQSAFGLCKLLDILFCAGVKFYFENPVMHGMAQAEIEKRLPAFSRMSRQTIQPWMFGHWETKRTCLWLHMLPPLVPTYRTSEECRVALGLPEFVRNKKGELVRNKPDAKCHKMSPGPNRGHERSRTLSGIAAAIAEQWGRIIDSPESADK